MSSLPPEEQRFGPTDDVNSQLEVLRSSGYVWIAEEIELIIRGGRPTAKEITEPGARGQRRKVESATAPYDPDEQLCIVLRTIRNYFVEPQKFWVELTTQLQRVTGDNNLKITVAPPEGEQSVLSLIDTFSHEQSALNDLLRKAWPHGPESYDRDVEISLE